MRSIGNDIKSTNVDSSSSITQTHIDEAGSASDIRAAALIASQATYELGLRVTAKAAADAAQTIEINNTLHSADTANQSKQISWFPTTASYEIKGYSLPNFGILWQYTAGAWGGTNTPFNGLPQTGMNSLLTIQNNNDSLYLFYDTGIVYTIDLSTQQVVSSAPYG
jgi:hypothetical protein